MKLVQKGERTIEMCNLAVKISGTNLNFIPDEMKTEEMCLTAINHRKSPGTLKNVPEKLRTFDVCSYALAQKIWRYYCNENDRYLPEGVKNIEEYMPDKRKSTYSL